MRAARSLLRQPLRAREQPFYSFPDFKPEASRDLRNYVRGGSDYKGTAMFVGGGLEIGVINKLFDFDIHPEYVAGECPLCPRPHSVGRTIRFRRSVERDQRSNYQDPRIGAAPTEGTGANLAASLCVQLCAVCRGLCPAPAANEAILRSERRGARVVCCSSLLA